MILTELGPKWYVYKQTKYKEYDYMNYSDVSKVDFQSKRIVNPLNPIYDIRDEDGKLIKYGVVEKSCPKVIPEHKNGPLSYTLKTEDISGAHAGTKGLGPFAERARTYQRQLVKCDDIEGAQVGTLQKAPKTIRQTNPLNPSYQFPGEKELTTANANNAFGQAPQTTKSPYEKLKKEEADLKGESKPLVNGKEYRKESENIVEDVAKFYGAPQQATIHQSVKIKEIKTAKKAIEGKAPEIKKEYVY